VKTSWPARPIIYEINTWVWLSDLSRQHKRAITLGTVPPEQWDAIASLNVDAVWLMGVWERSPQGIRIANANAGLQADFRRALPDYTPADNVGSAYCVRNYVVDQHLGGPEGLVVARQMLAQRGLRLILDFVPNHLATDHPWVFDHPDFFVQGTHEDLAQAPGAFFEVSGTVIANGRDPYFPPWQDVAQLNAFSSPSRQAIIEIVNSIAGQCDGMRCDMTMLLLNNIFKRTWGEHVSDPLPEEYWREVISAVRFQHPQVLFIAEAYWDLEWELLQQGFDYCYDKRLYDRLEHDTAESIRLHLTAGLDYQDKLVRFIENHDEPRAATAFTPERERVAALTMMTLPGAKLLYEGQIEGRRIRLPVFLSRRQLEPIDTDLQSFYRQLLSSVKEAGLSQAAWRLCERTGWPDNSSYLNLVAWCWDQDEARYLVVVNLSQYQSQARIQLPWDNLAGKSWHLTDVLSGDTFNREGDELRATGLYVDVPAWRFHFLRFQPDQRNVV
jgi:Alpha amylase, catalytic domain